MRAELAIALVAIANRPARREAFLRIRGGRVCGRPAMGVPLILLGERIKAFPNGVGWAVFVASVLVGIMVGVKVRTLVLKKLNSPP